MIAPPLTTTTPLNNLLTPPPVGPHSIRPFILVPLYIYPLPGAWAPLYAAAEAHPELDLYVIVNPSNGPGDGHLPDASYAEALARLTALRNVKVLGYVHCSYGNRPAEAIVEDVERYRAWERESIKADDVQPIIVDGIFIDETPSSTEYVQYLSALSIAAKTILNRNGRACLPHGTHLDGAAQSEPAAGRHGEDHNDDAAAATVTGAAADEADASPPGTPLQLPSGAVTPSRSSAIVIYNPGVVVDPIFYQAADYVVAFENSAAQWKNPVVVRGLRRLPKPLLERSIPVAHSAGGGRVEVVQLSRRVSELGCLGQFITSCPGYTDWCEGWDEFVGEMARRTMI